MAHYDVFVQDSSPLFIYSPPGAWIDTPVVFNDSPSLSYHATHIQGATVKLDFVGTGARIFSATTPTPGSYQVYVDGKGLPEKVGSSSKLDSQLLLGSITGLEMGPHTVTLVNSGVTGDILDLDRIEVESVLGTGSSSLSTATFDDSADEIRWGPGWVSAQGESAFYNGTIRYTEQPDAQMSFSFEGGAIAIYGTSGVEMGNYVVTLDGQSRTFNGGSDGAVRAPHDQTILYLANGLSVGRHELTITANPSSVGKPQVFNVDSIRVLSGSSLSGPNLLPPGSSNTRTTSTLPRPVPTGSSYTSLISDMVSSESTPLPTSMSSTLLPSLMPSSSSPSPTLFPTARFGSSQSDYAPRAASNDSTMMTDKGVISSAVASAVIAGIGLIFFALFLWKRKTLDPPSYADLERASQQEKGPTVESGERSPELPIQRAEKSSPSLQESGDPFAGHNHYRDLAEGKRGHSRNGSNTSSMTANDSAYNSYRETLQKRALLTRSISSIGSTCRDSVSDCDSNDLARTGRRSRGKSVDSISSVRSDDSRYSQSSERIIINDVRMPPQFATPTRPPSVAFIPPRPNRMSPPRPPRVRDSLALPF